MIKIYFWLPRKSLRTLKQTQKWKQMEVCCQKIDKILKKKIEISPPRTRKRWETIKWNRFFWILFQKPCNPTRITNRKIFLAKLQIKKTPKLKGWNFNSEKIFHQTTLQQWAIQKRLLIFFAAPFYIRLPKK